MYCGAGESGLGSDTGYSDLTGSPYMGARRVSIEGDCAFCPSPRKSACAGDRGARSARIHMRKIRVFCAFVTQQDLTGAPDLKARHDKLDDGCAGQS